MPTEHWTSKNPSNFEVPTLLNVLLDEMRSDAGMMSGFCGFNSLARAIAWHTVGGGGRLEETTLQVNSNWDEIFFLKSNFGSATFHRLWILNEVIVFSGGFSRLVIGYGNQKTTKSGLKNDFLNIRIPYALPCDSRKTCSTWWSTNYFGNILPEKFGGNDPIWLVILFKGLAKPPSFSETNSLPLIPCYPAWP